MPPPALESVEVRPLPSTAAAHARRLLADLDADPARHVDAPHPHSDPLQLADAPHPDLDWARCGGAALSGGAPAPLTACIRGAWAVARALAPAHDRSDLDAAALLCERAALAGLEGRGRTTAGGAGRLLRAADGWLAVQLPRPEDVAALPAWLEQEATLAGAASPFDAIAPHVVQRHCASLVERARLLGLAVAPLPSGALTASTNRVHAVSSRVPWLARTPARRPPARPRRLDPSRRLRVLDLSTLWAGPLCGRLLAHLGADVVKVESPRRPDGARLGPRAFFDVLHAGKASVAADPTRPEGRDRLRALIARADVVIESARPRGLGQLGIDAEALVAAQPGLTWVSITGYGRTPPRSEWVAFGDDAAVAAGLVACDDAGAPIFCGDAIADPLTGVHAAAAALAGVRDGGGLFDVPLVGVAALVRQTPFVEGRRRVPPETVARPRAQAVSAAAPALGADTAAVLGRWAVPPC